MQYNQKDISDAAQYLQQGKLVVFPTETVYGLGANACNDNAVAAVFAAKGRPSFNPLIIHVGSVEQAKTLVQWCPLAETLAQTFWPGPLTMVLPRQSKCPVSLLASAGLDSLAVRMPAHPMAQALLKEAALPLAAPSANRSGYISPTRTEHIDEDILSHIATVLDGGACEVGLESTVIAVNNQQLTLLRPGSITVEELEQCTGVVPSVSGNDTITSPGQMLSHYAPNARVRLHAGEVMKGEALLAFGSDFPKTAGPVLNLSEVGDLREAAANLFAYLRELDASGCRTIAVMDVPNVGLGVAINDRLARAAADRD